MVRPDHLPLHPASCWGALWQEKRFLLITQICFVGGRGGAVLAGAGGGGAWFSQRLTQRSKEAGDWLNPGAPELTQELSVPGS